MAKWTKYRVVSPQGATVAVGTEMRLSGAQADARHHCLTKLGKGLIYRVEAPVTLKMGEEFEAAGPIDKATLQGLVHVGGALPDGAETANESAAAGGESGTEGTGPNADGTESDPGTESGTTGTGDGALQDADPADPTNPGSAATLDAPTS